MEKNFWSNQLYRKVFFKEQVIMEYHILPGIL